MRDSLLQQGKSRKWTRFAQAAVVCLTSGVAAAAVSAPSISPSLPAPQAVGTSVTFTASSTDTDAGPLRYRFRIRPAGGTFATVRDFSINAQLAWTPTDTDGIFEIEVTATNLTTGTTAASSLSYSVSPAVSGSAPVVQGTSHPLVALYSAPACPAGSTMRVRFKLPADINWQATSLKQCHPTSTMNFYVGGMRANSTYQLRHDIFTGPRLASGPILTFTTGSISVPLPALSQLKPLVPPSSMTEGVTLFDVLVQYPMFGVDATGNVIWYNPAPTSYATRPVPGGTFLLLYGYTRDLANSGFREVDLAGNLVKETNIERMNVELAARGMHPVTVFHHEVRRLPNGNYLVLAMTERLSDVQGPNTDIAGDTILVLDPNLQLLWAWDTFDHLDVTRLAVLREQCSNGPLACVLLLANTANDWTHGNSVALAPDGNILYSSRHQDRLYKIAYENGAGDGHVIWTLGKEGDFTWNSSDPWPWFSHQHDASYASSNVISVFDNGNSRVSALGGGNSRGQAIAVDEAAKTVSLSLNADVGTYSQALGTAQRLLSGNYEFLSGVITGGHAQASEFGSNASLVSLLDVRAIVYRAFRLRDLYSAQ
jgi:arylsulfate sulfotransferase